jgi:hypothetical protein
MSAKYITRLVSVLVVAGCAAPLTAHAADRLQWWLNGGPMPLGKRAAIPSLTHPPGDMIKFDVAPSGASITCKVSFTDVVMDTSRESFGTDEMTGFQLKKCAQEGAVRLCPSTLPEVIAGGLPWASHLAEPPPSAQGTNVFEGVQLEFRCGGSKGAGRFSGTLTSLVKQIQPPGRRKPCPAFDFQGEPSLRGESGTVAVTGIDRVGRNCNAGHLEVRAPIK